MSKTTEKSRYEVLEARFREKIRNENNTIIVDDDIFEEVLPEGLTMDTVKKAHNFRSEVLSPITHIIAEEAHGIMSSNKSIDDITTSIMFGNEELGIRVLKKSNGVDSDGKPKKIYGDVIVSSKITLGEHQQQYDAVVDAIHDTFYNSFGKKKKKAE